MSEKETGKSNENEEIKYKQELVTPLSRCDYEGKLTVPDTAAMFMDIATLDAERRGVGVSKISELGIIWLTVRARYRFYRMPRMLENITLVTWPGSVARPKCYRSYLLKSGDELCAEAFVDWLLYDYKTNKIAFNLPKVFTEQSYLEEKACDGERAIIDKDFSACKLFGEITVKSVDIDTAGHMNNVAYIRELFGLFSTNELKQYDVKEIEISYMTPTMEGETLRVYIREISGGAEFGLIKKDGTISSLIKLTLSKRK